MAGNRIDSFAPAVGRCAGQAPHRRVLQDDTTALRRAERPHRRGRAPPAAQGVAGRAAHRRVFPRECLGIGGACTPAQNGGRWTALHKAAYNGHSGVIAMLLAAGASESVNNDHGCSSAFVVAISPLLFDGYNSIATAIFFMMAVMAVLVIAIIFALPQCLPRLSAETTSVSGTATSAPCGGAVRTAGWRQRSWRA